ncbi:quiescin sulfhydryl oxidase putative (QSOX) [Leptomonas seymouri]|uniref:Sulfhydryl oxidase n=1 Tax=Leptomonas seymouri TaxID=5684 RepID=A0A0N0P2H4_LEPSE|nr:quiescin sulfhydryl oxidase putative (QSOX) [Leptomonas seymouri]|eukprot:KPI82956.1 quiescin sulfhydryl oxidase putative (QSOX) [Leptomonas seymouri]
MGNGIPAALFVGLYVLLATLGFSGVSAAAVNEQSLFRTASEVVDIADLQLLHLHESAGRCPWIIMAYSDGCGHCRGAAPSTMHLARETYETPDDVMHEVTIAALNCQVYTQTCRDLGVEGVPAFFFLSPESLAAVKSTLAPIVLHPPKVTDGSVEKPERQTLHIFDIGRGGDLEKHLGPARSLWGSMTKDRWNAHSRERCLNMRSFLRNWKQSELAIVGPEGNPSGAAFNEDTRFHSVDVANAFFLTLYHEVSLVGLDSVERRYALNRFLRAVQRQLPGLGADVLLHEMVAHKNSNDLQPSPADFTSFTVADWQKLVLSAGIPFQGSPRDLAWKTCKGSLWHHRGFPCGLWLLYHALAANPEDQKSFVPVASLGNHRASLSAAADSEVGNAANVEILFIIKDYVRNFFSCEVCRRHFMSFAPNNKEDPGLQMWRVHNVVNFYLANVTAGADPLVPKRQFPGRTMCPTCYRDSGAVVTDSESAVVVTEMIQFLRKRYRWSPSSLYQSTYTTSPTAAAGEDGGGDGREVIRVQKSPMTVNILLTMSVVVVVVLFAMRLVLRRAKSVKFRKHRPILPLCAHS